MTHLKVILFAALVTVAVGASAQDIRRPPPTGTGCPPPGSLSCQLWPYLCEPCEPKPFNRLIPIPRLDMPRRVGVTALADDGGYNGMWRQPDGWPNWVATDEAVGYGVRAIQLWPMVPLDGEDMAWSIENPGIDTIVIRPMIDSFWDYACGGTKAATWEGDGWLFGRYAELLYERYGYLDKTIILTNWEADWQLWGASCREPDECSFGGPWGWNWSGVYAACEGDSTCEAGVCDQVRYNRALYLKGLFETRQEGVEAAAARHPEARLRVYHMVTVNHTHDTVQLNVTRDVIPLLEHPPHLVGLSHWDSDQTLVDALRYIHEHTRYPYYRMVLTEIGAKVGPEQGELIEAAVHEAFRLGVVGAYVWIWRQQFDGIDRAVIADDNTPNPALDAIQRLGQKYDR